MKKSVHLVAALALSVMASAACAETVWTWNKTIRYLEVFTGSHSKTACFQANGVDKRVCFSVRDISAKEQFSILLAARTSNMPIHFAYNNDTARPWSHLWFDHYALRALRF